MRLLALALLLVGGMVMASPIILVSLDREGSLRATFGQAALYAMDLDYNPFACEFRGTEDWRRTCEPSESPCAFLVEWDIETPGRALRGSTAAGWQRARLQGRR